MLSGSVYDSVLDSCSEVKRRQAPMLKASEPGVTDAPTGDWSCRQSSFLAMATLWVAAACAVSRDWAMEQLVFVGIGMLLLGVPMGLAGVCSGTLSQQRKVSAMFRQQGWLSRIWIGRWLRILMWTIWALGMSALLLLQLNFYDYKAWAVLFLIVPLYSVAFNVIKRRLSCAGMHEDMAVTQAAAWSRWLCPAVIVLLYVLTMAWLGDPPKHATIGAAIDARSEAIQDWSGNAVVGEALRGLAYFHGVEAYALGQLRALEIASALWLLALLVMGVGNFALLYNACLALSCFRIPRAGFVKANLVPRSVAGVFTFAVVATFLPLFVFFQLLAQLEPWASEIADQRKKLEGKTTQVTEALLVEHIREDAHCVTDGASLDVGHGCFYRQGTFEEVRIARTEAASLVNAAADQLRQEVDLAFFALESEAVDEYLDWYYSLGSEYGRLLILLTGGMDDFERHLSERARETFGQEHWFKGVDTAVEHLFASDKEAGKAYERAVNDILERNRIDVRNVDVEVARTELFEDIVQPSTFEGFVPATHRIGVAGAGGSAAGAGVARIVAHKITAKMIGKSAIKVAAKAPFKALAGKVIGGAVAGGVVGSVVPIFGNVIGAVGGAVVGIVGGVAIDAALLKFEEILSRDEFRQQIVGAIREARSEFTAEYFGASHQ